MAKFRVKDEALKMAIGKLVLEKMTSGNDVPVSRCTITNIEIHALSKEALEQPAQEPVAICKTQPLGGGD